VGRVEKGKENRKNGDHFPLRLVQRGILGRLRSANVGAEGRFFGKAQKSIGKSTKRKEPIWTPSRFPVKVVSLGKKGILFEVGAKKERGSWRVSNKKTNISGIKLRQPGDPEV